jgi:hypothetical protein
VEITLTVADGHFEAECARCGAKAENLPTVVRYHPVLRQYFAAEVMSPEGWTRVQLQNETHVQVCPPCTAILRGRLGAELASLGRPITGEVKFGGEDN